VFIPVKTMMMERQKSLPTTRVHDSYIPFTIIITRKISYEGYHHLDDHVREEAGDEDWAGIEHTIPREFDSSLSVFLSVRHKKE